MFLKFLDLEIKNFFRASTFATGVLKKILQIFIIIYFLICFSVLGIGAYYYPKEEMNLEPLKFISRFIIYAFLIDLFLRYFVQQMPTQNIKPFLTLNIKKSNIVWYLITKTFLSFFTWGNAFIYLPFIGLLYYHGYNIIGTTAWFIAIIMIYFISNTLNILMNGKDNLVYAFGLVIVIFLGLDYWGILSLLDFSESIIYRFYTTPWLVIFLILLFLIVLYFAYKFVHNIFYLDQGLELKNVEGKTENIKFLNSFGIIGTFINNDIRMMKRSKAVKSILFGSFMFLFYGLLMFSADIYQKPFSLMFLGLFVTGGFQFMFGQKVPSFDSSYYPLMMTLNVPYKEYIKAKWWLLNIATLGSMVLALFYSYFGWDVYFTFFAAGLYNIGVNSQFTLLSGAYNKSPMDLNATKKSMGKENNFSLKNILFVIPKMVVPMFVFGGANYFFGLFGGVLAIAIVGLIGFLLREKIFDWIIKLYKKEKYDTLSAFKKNNA